MSEPPEDDAVQPVLARLASSLFGYQVLSQVVSLVLLAVLMRVLDPSEFGVFAMALPLVMFARMATSWGLNTAVVQGQTLSIAERSAIFWTNLCFAVLGAVLLAAVAPLAARFYGESLLTPLTAAMGGTVLLSSLSGFLQALIERQLRVDVSARLRLFSQVGGAACAIAAACGGFGVWSFVVQHYVELILSSALLGWAARWRPTWPGRGTSIRSHLSFGRDYTLSSVMFWIAQNADTFLIGRLGGEHVLGLYSQAFNLMMKPVLLVTTPATTLMLPALCGSLSQPDAYRALVRKFFWLVGVALFPCSIGLFIVGEDVMLLLGGEQWRESGQILQALAPAILAQGFINIAGSVFASAGRADRLLRGSIVVAALLCVGFGIGWWIGGVMGVAVAWSVVTVVILLLPYSRFCLDTVDVPLMDVVAVLRRPLIAAVVMGTVVLIVRQLLIWQMEMPAGPRLVTVVPIGVLIYSGLFVRFVLPDATAGEPRR